MKKIRTGSFRDSLGMRLRGAYLSMHRCFNAHWVQFGSTADQYVVLTVLSEEDGITQQELVRRIYSDQNTVAAMLLLLEKRGLIKRRDHPADGRVWCIYLTPKGRRLQKQLDGGAECLHQQLREALLPEEKDAVLNSLKQIAEAMAPPDGRSWTVARRRLAAK
ncbi:MAG: MarR family transcriptional regulator [Acidobacteria bacterium]|nr:MarR family transcriptional regulator [Acidobacteriota bacterium]